MGRATAAILRQRPGAWLPWAALALLAALLPLADRGLPPAWRATWLLPDLMPLALAALGLNVLVGWAGQLNLGAAAFMAVGAYAYAILTSPVYPFALGFWGGLGIALAAGGGAGLLLGLPTMRLSGDYLAVVTLGFGEIVHEALDNLAVITKGGQGINPVPPPWLPGFAPGDRLGSYYLGAGLVAAAALLCVNLRRSRLGRAWVAVRDDELAARSAGVDAASAKLAASAVCGALGGLGGALFAALRGSSVSPSAYDFQLSVVLVCAVLVGGLGSVAGVLLGVLLAFGVNAILLDRLAAAAGGGGLANPATWKYLLYGLILVLAMRWRPQGLLPPREGRG